VADRELFPQLEQLMAARHMSRSAAASANGCPRHASVRQRRRYLAFGPASTERPVRF
jgi:hypothetical protein